jgi:predicted GNAT superfamily acetyltransferase
MTNIPNTTDKLTEYKDVHKIEYRKLITNDDLTQCSELQKTIFRISGMDVFSQATINVITRENPDVGVAVGVFDNSVLVGFIVGFARTIRSIDIVTMGLKEEYPYFLFGYKLLTLFSEIAFDLGVRTVYYMFDPLELNVGRLCFFMGLFTAKKYKVRAYTPDTTHKVVDIVEARWGFKARKKPARRIFDCATGSYSVDDYCSYYYYFWPKDLLSYPVARHDYFPDSPVILIEIPTNYTLIKTTHVKEAEKMRKDSRKVFVEYIKKRKYFIRECITDTTGGTEKTYYVLLKK